MISNYYAEILRKFQHASNNCGLKLKNKSESVQNILQRKCQLELENKTDSPEYQLMIALLKKCRDQ